jgi:hypothetical protein
MIGVSSESQFGSRGLVAVLKKMVLFEDCHQAMIAWEGNLPLEHECPLYRDIHLSLIARSYDGPKQGELQDRKRSKRELFCKKR